MVRALAEGHGYIVQFLSDHGVDTNRPNNDGLTSLHLASQGAHDRTQNWIARTVMARRHYDILHHRPRQKGHSHIVVCCPIMAQTQIARGMMARHQCFLPRRTVTTTTSGYYSNTAQIWIIRTAMARHLCILPRKRVTILSSGSYSIMAQTRIA